MAAVFGGQRTLVRGELGHSIVTPDDHHATWHVDRMRLKKPLKSGQDRTRVRQREPGRGRREPGGRGHAREGQR